MFSLYMEITFKKTIMKSTLIQDKSKLLQVLVLRKVLVLVTVISW
jgi:hypothetical protein